MPELVELLCVPATLTPKFASCARVTPVNVCTRAAEVVVRVIACDDPINVDPSRSCTDAADRTEVEFTCAVTVTCTWSMVAPAGIPAS